MIFPYLTWMVDFTINFVIEIYYYVFSINFFFLKKNYYYIRDRNPPTSNFPVISKREKKKVPHDCMLRITILRDSNI